MDDLIREWWALMAGAVGFILWLGRLEGRGKANAEEIRRLWLQRKEDLKAAEKARDDSNKMLAEIRGDVKQLLRKDKS